MDIDYTKYSIQEMDTMLGDFWFAVAPQKGEHYTVSSMHHIRYGIKRLMQSAGQTYDLTTDPRFSSSQVRFTEACKELKKKGFGPCKAH